MCVCDDDDGDDMTCARNDGGDDLCFRNTDTMTVDDMCVARVTADNGDDALYPVTMKICVWWRCAASLRPTAELCTSALCTDSLTHSLAVRCTVGRVRSTAAIITILQLDCFAAMNQ